MPQLPGSVKNLKTELKRCDIIACLSKLQSTIANDQGACRHSGIQAFILMSNFQVFDLDLSHSLNGVALILDKPFYQY